MDRERARFVLRSFRPDGADAEDADFAEALQLATSDRELGEWLVRERAFDAEFAECLARVALPEGLRASVLLAMVQNGSEFPRVNLKEEQEIVDAILAIKVPADLRARVIESMERTVISKRSPSPWVRFGVPLAAAAGIAFAFTFASNSGVVETQTAQNQNGRITVDAVQASFVRVYESPIFSLDQTGTNQRTLVSHLKGKGLPCGDLKFPPGLEHLKGLGCRELVVDGKRGSLLCLDEEGGTVHLIIFMRRDIDGELPDINHPIISQEGNWAKASWGNDRYAFALMAMRDCEDMEQFF